MEEAEAIVSELERAQAETEALISAGDTSMEIISRYETDQKRLENAMSVWELAQAELDNYTE